MKKSKFLPMLIALLFMMPVILVCRTPEAKCSLSASEQTLKVPVDMNMLNGQRPGPSNEGAIATQELAGFSAYPAFGLYGFAVTTCIFTKADATISDNGLRIFLNSKITNKLFLTNLTTEDLL